MIGWPCSSSRTDGALDPQAGDLPQVNASLAFMLTVYVDERLDFRLEQAMSLMAPGALMGAD